MRTALTMVEKSSSVRIIAAASFDTSVPVMPIAMPMSARFSAGASAAARACGPARFEGAGEPHFVLGRAACDDADPVDRRKRLVVAHRGPLRSRDRAAFDAELLRDRLGGDGVVAGDHAPLDPR